MKAQDFNAALGQESCLFEVLSEVAVEFAHMPKGRIVARALSENGLEESDCVLHVAYLSAERNVLHESISAVRFGNIVYTNPNAVASREFNLNIATTLSLPLDPIAGASTVLVTIRTLKTIFLRRDSMRAESADRSETTAPHSVMLTIDPGSYPRYLMYARPGRYVFTSRSCLGSKGLIATISALDSIGEKTMEAIGLVAWMSSLKAGAVVVPRARRLERPERFNKEIVIPTGTAFTVGNLRSIASDAQIFFDIFAIKLTRFRHAVGVPTGIALFERLSLQIHERALTSSREEFLALMQGD